MNTNRQLRPTGNVEMRVIRGVPQGALTIRQMLRRGLPWFGQTSEVFRWKMQNIPHFMRGLWRVMISRLFNLSHFEGAVYLKVRRAATGQIIDFGLASLRVVTNAGVNEIATRFAGTSAASVANFKYHGIGTTNTAESASDTALAAELSTVYNPDNTRATGSQTSSTNTYTTVGTNTVDGSAAIVEHGIFTQSATGGGTLLDRSVFSVINLSSGDSLQSTYTLTLASGG